MIFDKLFDQTKVEKITKIWGFALFIPCIGSGYLLIRGKEKT